MKPIVQIALVSAALGTLLACARKPVGDYEPEAGFDGPNLPFEPSVAEGTTEDGLPSGPDADGDGIADEVEAEMGLNPQLADSDGDGFDDGIELAENADPADPTHKPYAGGYGIDACRTDVVASGDAVGMNTADFQLLDQFGDTVRLHDFCGRHVLLVSSASWCGACAGEAPHLQDLYDSYEDQGFVVITLLGENGSSQAPTQADLQEWADAYGLTHPVVADPGYGVTTRFVLGSSIALPTMHLLGPNAEVLITDSYVDEFTLKWYLQ